MSKNAFALLLLFTLTFPLHIQGQTSSEGVCIFEGIMKKELYIEIFRRTLVPFIQDVYPESHRESGENSSRMVPKYMLKLAPEYKPLPPSVLMEGNCNVDGPNDAKFDRHRSTKLACLIT